MKRITGRRRQWLISHARASWIRKIRRQRKKGALQSRGLVEFERDGRIFKRRALPRPVPEVMSLASNYEAVMRWYSNLREKMSATILRRLSGRRTSGMHSYYDFSTISEITPEVALLIASEYDRAVKITGARFGLYNTRLWRRSVKDMLEDIGFFDLLGIQLRESRSRNENRYVKMCDFRSSQSVQSDVIGPFVEMLVENFLAIDASTLLDDDKVSKTMKLFGALVEATENTRQHAYSAAMRSDPTCAPRWWLTGAAYPEQKRLTLIVYDHGVSIPGSLSMDGRSAWPGLGWIGRGLSRLGIATERMDDPSNDHVKIRLAMAYGRSSTAAPNRGKGLRAIQEAVRHCKRGQLSIRSRSGEYVYTSDGRPQARIPPVPIPGTMIVWDLWL